MEEKIESSLDNQTEEEEELKISNYYLKTHMEDLKDEIQQLHTEIEWIKNGS